MRLQTEELLGQATLVRPGELGDGDLAVVVADACRHTAEEVEGASVSVVKGLGAFAWTETTEASVAVRQREDEQGGLVADTSDDDFSAAEVALCLAGWVEQRHEDLGLRLLV